MGVTDMYDKTTTSGFGDMTPQEQEFMKMLQETLLPNYLNQAGFVTNAKQTTFKESDEYKRLTRNLAEAKKNPSKGDPYANGAYNPNAEGGANIRAAQRALDEAEKNFKSTTTYDIRTKESENLEYLRDTYGENSSQYKEAKKTERLDKVGAEKTQNEIMKKYQENTLKYMNGDFSITPEQEKNIQENFKDVKAGVESMYKDTMDETMKAYGDFTKVAGENGMTTRDALGAVGAQIEQTGINMNKALDNVVSTRQALLKQGIEDATGEITKQVATKAAQLGRDPSDPEFENDMKDTIARQVKQGNLELGSMEAQARLGIEERTGSGLEGVANRQAEGRINAAMTKGQQNLNVEQGILNQRVEQGSGGLATGINLGQQTTQFDNALSQQRMSNAMTAMSPVQSMYGMYFNQRPRYQTQEGSPMDVMSGIMDVAQGAASAYTGIQTGNFLRSSADTNNMNSISNAMPWMT